MSKTSGTAMFKRSAAIELSQEGPLQISTIIANDVWPGLNWPPRPDMPFDPECRRVITRMTDPAYRNILNVLVCPARTGSAEVRSTIEQAWNAGDVVRVPWLTRGDGTLVLSPPYTTVSDVDDTVIPFGDSFSSPPVSEPSPTAHIAMTHPELAKYMALTSGETIIGSFFLSVDQLGEGDPDRVPLISSFDRGAQARAVPIITEVQPVPRSGSVVPSICWQEKHRSALKGSEKYRKFSDETSFRRAVEATLSEDPYLYAARERSEGGEDTWRYWTRQFTGRATPIYYSISNGNNTQYGVFEKKKDAVAAFGSKPVQSICKDGGATITRMDHQGHATDDKLIVSTTVQGLFQGREFPPSRIEFHTLPPVSIEQEHRMRTKWRAFQAEQARQNLQV